MVVPVVGSKSREIPHCACRRVRRSEREEKTPACSVRNDSPRLCAGEVGLTGEAVEGFAGAVEFVELFFFGAEFGRV
jgi:hypothetical protein